jgi:hypothetical protein
MKQISKEAYEEPEKVKSAPHRGITKAVDESAMILPEKCMFTYKKFKKVKAGEK